MKWLAALTPLLLSQHPALDRLHVAGIEEVERHIITRNRQTASLLLRILAAVTDDNAFERMALDALLDSVTHTSGMRGLGILGILVITYVVWTVLSPSVDCRADRKLTVRRSCTPLCFRQSVTFQVLFGLG